MTPITSMLHDIEGLDAIHWWPLAPGWWVLIVCGLAVLCIALWYMVRWIAFRLSWKYDTLQKLSALEGKLSEASAREIAVTLSEYLRRIALKRFSRKECAGMIDEAWLSWLTKHDPEQFDWQKRGVLLMDLPYAPVNAPLSIREIREMIQAVKQWVR